LKRRTICYASRKKKHEELIKKIKKVEMTKTELDLLKMKVSKLDHLLTLVSDKMECPVCYELPRSGPVPVCPNGHFVCNKCRAKTTSCPTCRIALGGGKSLLATIIMENIEHTCQFEECDQKFPLEGIENHEAGCLFRLVDCLHSDCEAKVSLPKLIEHLFKSDSCSNQKEMLFLDEPGLDWCTQFYEIDEDSQKDPTLDWPVCVYSHSGEVFAVFPIKRKGHYYVEVVMLATETECSKFKFEAVLHDEDSTVTEAEMTAKFEGKPIPIDLFKEDKNLFGTSKKFISKLIKNSKSKDSFGLSFRMSKK